VIVADVNVLAYLLIEGEHTSLAESVLEKDPAWAVPLLWRSELMSVLTAYVRTRALPIADAVAVTEKAAAVVKGREYAVRPERVFEVVSLSRCSSYDCEYVALAQDLGVRLVTSDKQVLAAFPGVAVSPAAFTRAASR
jgi:predicted nucleic acid-binding protein